MKGAIPNHLSPREFEVLTLVARGHSSKQIAELFGIGLRSVDKHRQACCAKLSAHSTAELVYRAFEVGAISVTVTPLIEVRTGRRTVYHIPQPAIA